MDRVTLQQEGNINRVSGNEIKPYNTVNKSICYILICMQGEIAIPH